MTTTDLPGIDAAAPDLYAVAAELVLAMTSPSRILLDSTKQEMQPILQMAIAALAKAEGK